MNTIMNQAVKAAFLLIGTVLFTVSTNADADDFAVIKGRVVDQLMEAEINDERIAEIIEAFNPDDGSFAGINYEDVSREAQFPQRRHPRKIFVLARAYKAPPSHYHQNDRVKEIIVRGLQHWIEHDYVADNWYPNQISVPRNLAHLMLLIGDALPADLVEQAQAVIRRATLERQPGVFYGARPGGDRMRIADIVAKNFLFLQDREAFDETIKIIAGEIKFNTGGRGMQHDFSFHHRNDRVNNTTSYGYGYANIFGEWAYYVAGTGYAFPTDRINHLVDYYLDGIYKQLVYGVYMDIGVINRFITQQISSRPRGTLEIERQLKSTDYRSDELTDILKLRKGQEANIRSFAKFFWQTEHFAFQRPRFYTSVRMYSTRNRNYEVPYNGPGIVTHHRADGANYLSLDGHEYDGIWPAYDWQKVSGTTVMQKPQRHVARRYGGNMPVQMEGLTDFVGGLDDGLYGAAVYDFKSPHDRLEARKSWFFFDNEYVCLGAGIHSEPDLPAYTTINQARLRGDVTLHREGQTEVLPQEKSLDAKNIKWVHHDGVGYILPEPAAVNLSNRTREGRWSDISADKRASEELVSRDIFLLGIDHGMSPEDASYQYIVVPGVTPEQLSVASANNRGIEILSNTPALQAVMHKDLGICQIAFFEAGEIELAHGASVSMYSHGMAMLKMEENRIKELTVSDPSRTLNKISLTVSGVYDSGGENFTTHPNADQNNTEVVINLPDDVYAGSSITISL